MADYRKIYVYFSSYDADQVLEAVDQIGRMPEVRTVYHARGGLLDSKDPERKEEFSLCEALVYETADFIALKTHIESVPNVHSASLADDLPVLARATSSLKVKFRQVSEDIRDQTVAQIVKMPNVKEVERDRMDPLTWAVTLIEPNAADDILARIAHLPAVLETLRL